MAAIPPVSAGCHISGTEHPLDAAMANEPSGGLLLPEIFPVLSANTPQFRIGDVSLPLLHAVLLFDSFYKTEKGAVAK